MYRKNIKTSARQARLAKRVIVLKRLKMRAQAERARAESEYERAQLERKRAEWAEQRVEELTRQIAEQERLSKTLHESEEHFRHIALHDSLTGLPNRALLIDRLKCAIERANRSKPYLFAVLFLYLDCFKNINDSLGNTYCDQLIITIAISV